MGLKQGNVATFGATSRRDREGLCQRRDVRGNVATFQRVLLTNVATLQRLLIINVATFQRVYKSTSRRSRDTQNPRRDVRISRRDVLEKGQNDVATLKRRDVTKKASKICTLSSPGLRDPPHL